MRIFSVPRHKLDNDMAPFLERKTLATSRYFVNLRFIGNADGMGLQRLQISEGDCFSFKLECSWRWIKSRIKAQGELVW